MKKTEAVTITAPSFLSTLEFVFYIILAVAIPFFLEKPQILVGSVVNMVLVLAALKISGEEVISVEGSRWHWWRQVWWQRN